MGYPHSGSQLTDEGRNTTRTAVSTQIIIQVDGNPIGAIKSLSINEDRDIASISEIGTDGIIDSVPKSSTKVSGDCERTRFDGLRIASAFSRGFVHVSAQRIPFDIVIMDIFAADEDDSGSFNDSDSVVTTVIKNVWIKSIKTKFSSDEFVIVDNMSWVAEHIFSYIGQDQSAASSTDARQLNVIDQDDFERQADLGKRRGSLDAAGLIRVVDSEA